MKLIGESEMPPHKFHPSSNGEFCTYTIPVGCFGQEMCWQDEDDAIHIREQVLSVQETDDGERMA